MLVALCRKSYRNVTSIGPRAFNLSTLPPKYSKCNARMKSRERLKHAAIIKFCAKFKWKLIKLIQITRGIKTVSRAIVVKRYKKFQTDVKTLETKSYRAGQKSSARPVFTPIKAALEEIDD